MNNKTLKAMVASNANRNQNPAARPWKPLGPPWFCWTLVWIEVIMAAPAADPSCRAQVKMAPTMPADSGGVEAKRAMLGNYQE